MTHEDRGERMSRGLCIPLPVLLPAACSKSAELQVPKAALQGSDTHLTSGDWGTGGLFTAVLIVPRDNSVTNVVNMALWRRELGLDAGSKMQDRIYCMA